MTGLPLARLVESEARRWARELGDAVSSGRIGVRTAELAVKALDDEGYHELASGLRSAVETRKSVLRSRGFTSLGGAL